MKAFRFPASWVTFGIPVLLLASTIALRIWFWRSTGETLEDSFITLRYAENIAAGRGFTYNTGEHVLGTTTPLWTLILAAVRAAGITDLVSAAKLIGIACDAATLLILLVIFRAENRFASFLIAVLVATSPWIVRISVSGMETPLLLTAMSIALLGLQRRNIAFAIGLALTLLTRFDGILFAGILILWSLYADGRWTGRQAGIIVLLLLPWIIFALSTFGSIVPQSFEAKKSLYHLGLETSAPPFLNVFTPFESSGVFQIMVKSLWGLAVLGSVVILAFRRGIFLPPAISFLVYTAAFMMSGTPIFAWYIVPAVFLSSICIAAAAGWAIDRFAYQSPHVSSIVCGLTCLVFAFINCFALEGQMRRSRDVQEMENGLRKEIGVWLKEHAEAGASIILEPIGYIGYFAGSDKRIMDEIGLVTPRVVPYRKAGAGWYVPAIQGLDPDYIVQYAAALESNRSEGTGDPLFGNDGERSWFQAHYSGIARFRARGEHPLIAGKEKEYIVLKRTRP